MLGDIKTAVINLDYSWKNPASYVVLVPVLSLVVEKIKLANLNMSFEKTAEKEIEDVTDQMLVEKKLINICKWHLLGSLTQMAACAALVTSATLPTIVLLGLVGLCVSSGEFIYTFGKSVFTTVITLETIRDEEDNGEDVHSYSIQSALGAIFSGK